MVSTHHSTRQIQHGDHRMKNHVQEHRDPHRSRRPNGSMSVAGTNGWCVFVASDAAPLFTQIAGCTPAIGSMLDAGETQLIVDSQSIAANRINFFWIFATSLDFGLLIDNGYSAYEPIDTADTRQSITTQTISALTLTRDGGAANVGNWSLDFTTSSASTLVSARRFGFGLISAVRTYEFEPTASEETQLLFIRI